jgi:hypothetical protein
MVSSPSPWARPVGGHGRCHGALLLTTSPGLGVLLFQRLGFPVDLDGPLFGDPLVAGASGRLRLLAARGLNLPPAPP